LAIEAHYMAVMPLDRGSERPRTEPEIIPPGEDGRAERGPAGIWMRVEERDGTQRIYIGRPSIPALIVGLMIVGFVAALAFLAMAGLLLVWIPILVVGIVAALLSNKIRWQWRRLKLWWAGAR
jgi:hypothetical protein